MHKIIDRLMLVAGVFAAVGAACAGMALLGVGPWL